MKTTINKKLDQILTKKEKITAIGSDLLVDFLGALSVIVHLTLYISAYGLFDATKYLTNWGSVASLMAFCLGVFNKTSEKSSQTTLRAENIILHISASWQFLIVTFFWVFLRHHFWDTVTTDGLLFGLTIHFCEHFSTGALNWSALLKSKITLPISNVYYLVSGLFIYVLSNFLFTYFEGVPVYSVLTWKSWDTAVFLLVAAFISLTGFFMAYFVKKTPQSLTSHPLVKIL